MGAENKLAAFHTLVAFAAGVLIALAAHASGKPWWVDHPFMGDATDLGVLTAVGLRIFLSMFERTPA